MSTHEAYLRRRDKALEYSKIYHATHREKRNAKARASSFKRRYGITLDERDAMIFDQNERCAICGRLFSMSTRPEIDHCHLTGKVRGILCTFCNSLLGYAKDSQLILKNAQKYLANSQGNLITFG